MDQDNTTQKIASVLRAERVRRGLTQQDLAEFLDVNRSYIVELESAKATLHMQRLIDALNAVGVDLVARPRA